MLFKPSAAGYSYGNSFAVRDKLNTDPNLTPNPNRPTSQKKHDAIAAVNTAVVRHQHGLKWRYPELSCTHTVVKAPKSSHITPSSDLCTGSRLMNAERGERLQ